MWDVNKGGEKGLGDCILTPKGTRVGDKEMSFELRYLYDDRGIPLHDPFSWMNGGFPSTLEDVRQPSAGSGMMLGNLIRESWYDSSERPVLNDEGISSVVYHWDRSGQQSLVLSTLGTSRRTGGRQQSAWSGTSGFMMRWEIRISAGALHRFKEC